MSTCARCGVDVRWVTVKGEGKIPLDKHATHNGRYALDPNDVHQAFPVNRPGLYGYENHDETCRQPIR